MTCQDGNEDVLNDEKPSLSGQDKAPILYTIIPEDLDQNEYLAWSIP